jgi:hypothetical protein
MSSDAEHGLPASTVPPSGVPGPAAAVVGPHQLKGANPGAEEPHRELEMHVRMLDLDDLDEKPVLEG